MISLTAGDFDLWRRQARALLATGVGPSHVVWESQQGDLLGDSPLPDNSGGRHRQVLIPRAFIELAETVSRHRDPQRWQYLYQMAFRLAFENRQLLTDYSDPDTMRLRTMARAIAQDIHKMQAFLRFRRIPGDDADLYTSWYEPAHYILEQAAPFFIDRFSSMCWSILTPDGCLHWDGRELAKSAAVGKPPPQEDDLEQFWLTYYRSIFNPARLNERAMVRAMPVRFWRNLPEARVLPELLQSARATTGRYLADIPNEADTARRHSRKLRSLQDQLRERVSEVLEPVAQAGSGPGLDFVVDIEGNRTHGGGERA